MIMAPIASLTNWLCETDESNYWHESARPLTSLIFVLPILACYEMGIVLLGPQAMRNGADVWLRLLLDGLGFGQYFVLPLLTCFVLYGWHHLSGRETSVDYRALVGMLLECALLAFVLLSLARLQTSFLTLLQGPGLAQLPPLANNVSAVVAPATMAGPVASAGMVGFLGAGIYEELLFRLLLLPAIFAGLRWLGEPRRLSLRTAVLVSSLIFAAAHYQTFIGYGESLDLASFVFRCSAGIFFGILFVCRGFGVAVGVHSIYDILASMVSA